MSDRDLDPDLESELIKSMLCPIFMVEAFFDSGTLRFWSGIGTLIWYDYNGTGEDVEFNGSGNLLTIQELAETQSIEAVGTSFTLNGINQAIISLALEEHYQGRVVNVYLSALDEDFQIIGVPYLMWGGFMDQMEIQDSGDTSNITVTAENRLLILKETRTSRLTPEDQKRKYPNDKGLDFVPAMQNRQITWGFKVTK